MTGHLLREVNSQRGPYLHDTTAGLSVDISLPARYRIRQKIGNGGMATVYLAFDELGSRDVAIKVLRPDVAGIVPQERFLREIRLNQSVAHPRIVPLLDSGDAGGLPFLVMPVANGGSLRERLGRERQLGIEDVIRITSDVASALDAAHRQGVVHRDVKPGNILLDDGRAMLADFGIAKAFIDVARDTLTESGIVIGTVGYMSPEQASGERDVDARSDIYSLAAVTYEMLAGELPYAGPSAQVVVAKQLALPVPSVTLVRETLPAAIDDVMRKALAKVPADRFESAGAFARALSHAANVRPTTWSVLRRRVQRDPRILVGGVVLLAGLALAWPVARPWMSSPARVERDTTRLLVVPPSGVRAQEVSHDEVLAAVRRWTGLDIVDARDVSEGEQDAVTPRQAARVAASINAGRFLLTRVRRHDAQTEIELRLFGSVDPVRPVASVTGRLSGPRVDPAVIGRLVDSLLLRNAPAGEALAGGTRSLPARQAYLRGRQALIDWDLPAADSAFDQSTRLDAQFADAQLFLALVRAWNGVEPARWRIAAEQAALGMSNLTMAGQSMARALVAQAQQDFGTACTRWRDLVVSDPRDGFARFGSAHCLASDNLVIPDRRSPSGWRFRSSYFDALREYQRAFELRPQILVAFGREGSAALRRLFRTAGNELRRGRSATGAIFSSSAEWDHDSLLFIPYPWTGEHVYRRPGAVVEAVRHQRERIKTVAASWVAASPASADAWLALSEALGALDDPAAIDTLAVARSRARTREQLFRIAITETALQLGFAVSNRDLVRLQRSRHLADSLLRTAGQDDDPRALAGLAALTGRAALAVRYTTAPVTAEWYRIPVGARSLVPRLLVYSAFGGPADTLRDVAARVSAFIEQNIPEGERLQRRMEWVSRAASMAYPTYRFERLEQIEADGDPLVALQMAWSRGDTGQARRGLEQFRNARREVLAEQITFDALAPEAALLLATGDPAGAASWLDPALSAMPRAASSVVTSAVHAASLGIALSVRARAAAAVDERDAGFWQRAIDILWGNADEFLKARARDTATRALTTPR